MEIGECVRLRSGGPDMTVSRYLPENKDVVVCTWFDGRKLKEQPFAVATLRRVAGGTVVPDQE